MAARTIGAGWLDVLIMASETRGVIAWLVLKEFGLRCEIFTNRFTQLVERARRSTVRKFWQFGRRLMTYRTVVELRFVVCRSHPEIRRHKMSDRDIATVRIAMRSDPDVRRAERRSRILLNANAPETENAQRHAGRN